MPMNIFHYTGGPTKTELAELFSRSVEIKHLIDNTRPKAIENTRLAQETQKETQDNNLRVTNKKLAKNTKVLIRNDGIKPKLDARYQGPYRVIARTELDNYILEDATGKVVEQEIPLQKLKVVELDHVEEDLEVEKILDHKDEDNVRYYLVKWRSFDDSENTWEPETNFNTKGVIKAYLRKLPKEPVIHTDRPKRGRKRREDKPKRGKPMINPISIMSMIWMTLVKIGLCDTSPSWNIVNAKVFLCSGAYNKLPIDIESICKEKTKEITESSRLEQVAIDEEIKASGELVEKRIKEWSINTVKQNNDFIKIDVYTKEMHSVIGTGTQCYKTKVTWTFQ